MQSLFGTVAPSDPVTRAIAAATPMIDAGPWRQIDVRAIGGLWALGFDRASEVMLVVSANGQSVIDGTTGDIIYRNREEDGLDTAALKGTRLDHPADERFDMAGMFGGALRNQTNDGWTIERIGTACVLNPPGASIHYLQPHWSDQKRDTTFYLLDDTPEDVRVFGFSWSGRTIVLGTSSTLMIWGRPAPLTL